MSPPRPHSVQIDASMNCQLACPLCPTADGRVRPSLGAGHLKVADFESLLRRNPQIAHVELSNYGEMFLNPQLPELLACAFERQVMVTCGNGANLNFASDAALEALVRYRVYEVTCAIDGATQETYARYRVKGDLNRVLGHIDRIRELRAKFASAFPRLTWQFIVFGHNEHEIEAARSMAAERGMGFFPKLSWDAEYSPVRNRELVRIQTGLGAADRIEGGETHYSDYVRGICYQLWNAPVMNWNGAMLGCCVNYWKDFGVNGFEASLAEAVASPNLEYARRMLMGEAEARPEIPCTTCGQYMEIRKSGRWLRPDEIQRQGGLRYAAGIVLRTAAGVRVAQVAVAAGDADSVRWPPSGRLFRPGVDSALYFGPAGPGRYTVFVRPRGPSGWMPVIARQIDIASRPTCQQFTLDLAGQELPARMSATPFAECLPVSIR
jgi:hypothetical protein